MSLDILEPAADAVRVGRFLLGNNPSLTLPLAESLARDAGIGDLASFLARHKDEPAKPVKLTKDELENIIWKNPPPARSDLERRFFQRALERVELDVYFDNLRAYERKKEEYEFFIKSFPPSVEGYISFASSQSEAFRRFFFEQYKVLPVSEKNRERHTYIVGGSGSGKSELLKAFLYHYLKRNTSTAVVLLDPHGKLSREVARWPELQGERLVYIRPGIGGNKTPVFNPFDISDEQRQNPSVMSVLVDDTIDIIAEILDRDFTPNMDTLLRACLYILYSRKNSTFLDVLRFLDIERNADLVEVGRRIFSPASPLLSVLLYDLPSQALAPTRQAIKMRLTSLLSRHFISSFLIGESSFNLDEALKAKKFIIFNLSSSDIGATESGIFGKFILAHVKAFGFRQGKEDSGLPIVPVHVFADECQEFITRSLGVIIEQLRKFGIHLTLAQQSIGRGMPKELEKAVLTNTAVKIIGKNSEADIKRFCAETGADPADLTKLEKGAGWFCVHSDGQKPVVIKTPGHRLDNKGEVKLDVWNKTLAAQLERYYTERSTTITSLENTETASAGKFGVANGSKLEIDY